jgi:membrane associated rhomboid family serine protease
VLNIAIIIVTSLVSIYAFYNPALFERMKFSPYDVRHRGQAYRFLSYGLVHADWVHLFINMFVLYSFGKAVVEAYTFYFGMRGLLFYLMLYLGGIAFSVLVDYGKHKENVYYSAVGASGAVSAVLFASILLYPTGSVFIFPIPFPVPSVIFGVLYLAYSVVMARRGRDNIGHTAHFMGAIFGLAFTIALKPALVNGIINLVRNLF